MPVQVLPGGHGRYTDLYTVSNETFVASMHPFLFPWSVHKNNNTRKNDCTTTGKRKGHSSQLRSDMRCQGYKYRYSSIQRVGTPASALTPPVLTVSDALVIELIHPLLNPTPPPPPMPASPTPGARKKSARANRPAVATAEKQQQQKQQQKRALPQQRAGGKGSLQYHQQQQQKQRQKKQKSLPTPPDVPPDMMPAVFKPPPPSLPPLPQQQQQQQVAPPPDLLVVQHQSNFHGDY